MAKYGDPLKRDFAITLSSAVALRGNSLLTQRFF